MAVVFDKCSTQIDFNIPSSGECGLGITTAELVGPLGFMVPIVI